MQVSGSLAGRPGIELDMAFIRELEEGDILHRASTPVGSKPPAIKQLRATHHKLAQNLAMGFSDAECSISTGYSPSRISILKNDPAFQELLAFYQSQRTDVFVDVVQRMAGAATTAVEVLQDRLEDSPESFNNKDLLTAIKVTADRGGYSPIQKTENKTIVLDARQLQSMKKEVEAKQSGQVRKINQTEEAARVKVYLAGKDKQGESGDTEPKGSAHDNTSGAICNTTEAEGQPWEGADI